MPFWEQEVKIPAVNYRGARKIGGAKTRGRSVQCGTDIPKMERIIGNTPSRLGRSRLQRLLSCLVVLYSYHQSSTKSVDFPVFMGIVRAVLSLICR